ncbi:hypothetical protein KC315_g5014 [Hortaea werneckii]|nr:hypothetical protein KC315_g5014 [Hortaea werneckii]KAI7368095.1 hypothetical protein KC354_g2929 [Hortaea werneckii]
MTSYQARGKPFFPVDGGSDYVSADDIKYPNVFVYDGDQLGLSASRGSGFPLENGSFPLYNASDPELYAACVGYDEARFGQVEELWHQNWQSFLSAYPIASDYASKYAQEPSDGALMDELVEAKLAFNKTRNSLPLRQSITDQHKPSSWSFTLWPRNVTWDEAMFFLDNTDFMDSAIHVRNTTYDLDTPIGFMPNFIWDVFGGQRSRIRTSKKGKCLPSKDYVWGFSSLMLFTFCILTILVLSLLIVLHYDAYWNSMADRYKLRISAFRDVLDLAEELRAHYGEAEVASMSAPELDKCMQTDPAMSGLETATLRDPRAARWKQGSLRLRVPTWAKWRKALGGTGSSTSDAEESLMSIGLDKHESGFGLGKMPSKAVTRQST